MRQPVKTDVQMCRSKVSGSVLTQMRTEREKESEEERERENGFE